MRSFRSFRDSLLDPAAHDAITQQRADRRQRFELLTSDHIASVLRTDPLASIPANWAIGPQTPACVELASWVLVTNDDAASTLGIAAFHAESRDYLLRRFAAAYAAAAAETRDFDGEEWESA